MSPLKSRAIEGLALKERDPARALEIAAEICRDLIDAPRSAPLVELPLEVELLKVVDLATVAYLRGTHVASVVREDQRRIAEGKPSQILHVSDRRRGMRLRDALMLPD